MFPASPWWRPLSPWLAAQIGTWTLVVLMNWLMTPHLMSLALHARVPPQPSGDRLLPDHWPRVAAVVDEPALAFHYRHSVARSRPGRRFSVRHPRELEGSRTPVLQLLVALWHARVPLYIVVEAATGCDFSFHLLSSRFAVAAAITSVERAARQRQKQLKGTLESSPHSPKHPTHPHNGVRHHHRLLPQPEERDLRASRHGRPLVPQEHVIAHCRVVVLVGAPSGSPPRKASSASIRNTNRSRRVVSRASFTRSKRFARTFVLFESSSEAGGLRTPGRTWRCSGSRPAAGSPWPASPRPCRP